MIHTSNSTFLDKRKTWGAGAAHVLLTSTTTLCIDFNLYMYPVFSSLLVYYSAGEGCLAFSFDQSFLSKGYRLPRCRWYDITCNSHLCCVCPLSIADVLLLPLASFTLKPHDKH